MSSTKKISAVILTLNEQHNLPRCLDSITGLVDEVIVVDSFSTDKTEEICKAYGVRFIQNKFEGFIQQRTYAVNAASNDFVLALDADEAVSKELFAQIQKAKSSFSFDGYTFNRLSCIGKQWIRHSGWYPDTKLRLWNRTKGMPGGINPHDQTIMQPNTTLKHLKGDLLHYSFENLLEVMDQNISYAKVAAQNQYSIGKRSSIPEIVFAPPFKFFANYIFRFGFLDGSTGFFICAVQAMGKFLKSYYLYQIHKEMGS